MTALALAARWRESAPRFSFAPALETAAAVLVILLFSGALLGQLFGQGEGPDPGAILRLVWPPVYLITLVLIMLKPMPVLRLMVRAWPVMTLAGLSVASMAWSIESGISLRRGAGVLMTAVFALWLASRYDWIDLIRLLALSSAILAVGSLIMAVAVPQYGVMAVVHPGAWSGMWVEKNTLGAVMAIATAATMAATLSTPHPRERWIWAGFVILCVFLVLMSTSRTALMACMIGFLGPLMIMLARQGFVWGLLAVFAGVFGVLGLGLILAIGPGVILEALGRDPTLTGRTDIWIVLIDAIMDRPWTGYGFGAYWEVEFGPVFWVRQSTAWEVPSAHNAWLEIALGLGVPGMVLALICYFSALLRAIRRLFAGPEAFWALPGLAVWGLTSLSESILMLQHGFTWVLFVLTFCKLASRSDAHHA